MQNRLVNIVATDTDTAILNSLYDAEGNRVLRQVTGEGMGPDAGETTTTIYLIGYETDIETGDKRIPHTLAGKMVAITINDQLKLAATDHLGSGSVVTDRNGEAAVVQRYTPFGFNRTGENMLGFDQTFTGQTNDPGTGLIDYNARHYDPQLGRFITADPTLDGLNRYAYVRNNPLTYIDPTGLVCAGTTSNGIRYGCSSDDVDYSNGYSFTDTSDNGEAGGGGITGWFKNRYSDFTRGLLDLCITNPFADDDCDALIEIHTKAIDSKLRELGLCHGYDNLECQNFAAQILSALSARAAGGQSQSGADDGRNNAQCGNVENTLDCIIASLTAAGAKYTSDNSNAVRHCLWAGSLTVELGESDARGFLDRHEVPNSRSLPSDQLDPDTNADLHNNEVGIAIGNAVRSGDQGGNVADGCDAALLNGDLDVSQG